jgi:hypothetical protein
LVYGLVELINRFRSWSGFKLSVAYPRFITSV